MKTGKVFVIVLLLELFVAAIAISADGFSIWGLQTLTRYSGRLSLAVFSIIFIWHNRPGNMDVLLLRKPFHFFAIAHGIHLIELLTFVYLAATPILSVRTLGGFVAYAFIFAMPFIADRREAGRLNASTYAIMEIVFQYYVWLIFFLTYLPRVQGTLPSAGGSYWEHVALLGWVSLLLGMKITSLLRIKPSASR
jgi:hypothetical protein